MGLKSVGYYQATSLATAKDLATATGAAVPDSADHVTVQAEVQPIRWRDDGTAPTASVGNLIAVGTTVTFRRGQFANLKLIETTTSAKANIDYFKTG